MSTIDNILRISIYIFGILISYRVIYTIIGLLFPDKKFKETDVQCTYAFLIACRNEEAVIGHLIDSIKKQDYPQDKLSIFVCADRCTDNTAKVAREAGAIVYERENPPPNKMRRSKGFAIQYMLERIKEDYEKGIETFDGVFMLDADGLLAPNYVTEYNKAFQYKQYDFFNSYINSKNYSSNFISSFSGVDELGSNVFNGRPRGILGISNFARGRGVLYRSYMLAPGWSNRWCNISIDTNSSSQMIAQGYRSSYCGAAELFDEKTMKFNILCRQRMRWSRGGLNAFFNWFFLLFLGIFWPRDWRKTRPATYVKPKFSLLAELQKRFSCYDSILRLMPISAITFIYTALYPAITATYNLFIDGGHGWASMLTTVLVYFGGLYLSHLVVHLATIVREHRRMRVNPWLMLLYMPFWPLLNIVISYVQFWALCVNVKWKPIPHPIGKTVDQMTQEKTIAEIVYGKKDKENERKTSKS